MPILVINFDNNEKLSINYISYLRRQKKLYLLGDYQKWKGLVWYPLIEILTLKVMLKRLKFNLIQIYTYT